jgi:hydroxyquinol 1,2-dioxygenase
VAAGAAAAIAWRRATRWHGGSDRSRVRPVRNLDEDTVTQAVIARLAETPDPRLRQVMTGLVQHLHAFAREVRLTEAEWFEAVRFLTAVGQKCDDRRQEFILLSDTLGLSMLVTALNHRKPPGCTEATVFGPFHVEGAPHFPLGADVANGAKGEPCFVQGRIRSLDGRAVPGAVIEVWQADADGCYDVQRPELQAPQARGVLQADGDGGYRFRTIVAEPYPIPTDGPVGDLLRATARHPWRPAHLHFMIRAPGYESLITHVFRDGDRYLDSDAVFGVRSSLVADWVRHEAGAAPDGTTLDRPFYTLDFDFVLNPLGEDP